MIDKHVPPDQRSEFFFHATDIYSGGDKKCIFHDKNVWPDERRWAILDDLVAVPTKFRLPICIGEIPRVYIGKQWTQVIDAKQRSLAAHALAIMCCEIAVDQWMKRFTKNEVAFVTFENNNDVRKHAKEAHLLFKDRSKMDSKGVVKNHSFFPLKYIKDGLQFAFKEESKLLQVADICAWAYRRHVRKAPDAVRFFEPMRRMVQSVVNPDHPASSDPLPGRIVELK